MKSCCEESFYMKGQEENVRLALALPDEWFTCQTCGRIYALVTVEADKPPVWTFMGREGSRQMAS